MYWNSMTEFTNLCVSKNINFIDWEKLSAVLKKVDPKFNKNTLPKKIQALLWENINLARSWDKKFVEKFTKATNDIHSMKGNNEIKDFLEAYTNALLQISSIPKAESSAKISDKKAGTVAKWVQTWQRENAIAMVNVNHESQLVLQDMWRNVEKTLSLLHKISWLEWIKDIRELEDRPDLAKKAIEWLKGKKLSKEERWILQNLKLLSKNEAKAVIIDVRTEAQLTEKEFDQAVKSWKVSPQINWEYDLNKLIQQAKDYKNSLATSQDNPSWKKSKEVAKAQDETWRNGNNESDSNKESERKESSRRIEIPSKQWEHIFLKGSNAEITNIWHWEVEIKFASWKQLVCNQKEAKNLLRVWRNFESIWLWFMVTLLSNDSPHKKDFIEAIEQKANRSNKMSINIDFNDWMNEFEEKAFYDSIWDVLYWKDYPINKDVKGKHEFLRGKKESQNEWSLYSKLDSKNIFRSVLCSESNWCYQGIIILRQV